MKEYKKLKKFIFTLQAKLEKDPSLMITTDLVQDLLAETKIDLKTLGGAEDLTMLLKIHPRFSELSLQ
jgi:hypothetical protein